MKSITKIVALLCIATCAISLQAQGAKTKVVNGKTYNVHKVVSGETLYKISKKYGCTVQEIQDANNLGTTLKIGQEVLIPTKSQAAPVEGSQTSNYGEHKVVKGETLSKIAKQYHTTVEELKRVNNLTTEGLRIGQVLKIPVVASKEVENPVVTPDPVKPENPAPVENRPEIKEERAPEKAPDKQPAGPRNPVAQVKDTARKAPPTQTAPVGGMPRTAEMVLAETATEKEEKGMAKVVQDKMDPTRNFVMHPSLPKGSIIVVINESSGKMAYCKVVENVKVSDLSGASIAITPAVADKIGLKHGEGSVKIKYAAP